MLDGALLVDTGAQWDTSQVWSANESGDSYLPFTRAFDGDMSTAAVPTTAGTIRCDFLKPISNVTKVELYAVNYLSGVTNTAHMGNGDSTTTPAAPGPDGWYTAYDGAATTFLGVSTGNTINGSGLVAVKINGSKILVDGTAVWNTDQVWSDGLTAQPGGQQGQAGPGNHTFNGRCRSTRAAWYLAPERCTLVVGDTISQQV